MDYSIMCALNAGDVYLATLSIKAAHFFVGEEFLPWALGMMSGSPQVPVQIADSWRSLMTEIVGELERNRAADEEIPVLRVHMADGTKVFRLGKSNAN